MLSNKFKNNCFCEMAFTTTNIYDYVLSSGKGKWDETTNLCRAYGCHYRAASINRILYLFISIVLPLFLTYYIFSKDIVAVYIPIGITWCLTNNDYLNEWENKMLYIQVSILVIILFLLYFIIKCSLKQ
eukprot:428840_1